MPVFVDSPLAADMAEVYRRHPEYLDPALARQLEHDPGFLGGETVRYVRPVEESRQLTTRRGPCIVVASGRMLGADLVHAPDQHPARTGDRVLQLSPRGNDLPYPGGDPGDVSAALLGELPEGGRVDVEVLDVDGKLVGP